MKAIKFLVYSNIFIALCAAASIFQTEICIGHGMVMDKLLVFIFGATLGVYSLHRLLSPYFQSRDYHSVRETRLSAYRMWMILTSVAGIAMVAGTFFYFDLNTKLRLVLPAIFSLCYMLPIPFLKKRIKDIPFIKIFFIAITWGYVTVYIPRWYYMTDLDHGTLYFIARSAFLFAITIPFDIRDMEKDSVNGVRTIPLVTGASRAVNIAGVALFISFLCFTLLYINNQLKGWIFIFLGLQYVISYFLIGLSRQRKGDLYYSFGIDGLLILQFLFVWLGDAINSFPKLG